MRPHVLNVLRCPACAGSVTPEREVLLCGACGKRYPILGDIPRFVPSDNYVNSFGFEWNKFDVATPQEDDEIFRVKTGWTPEMLKGKLVLDAGCGGGRYSAVAARWGARVVSLDMSSAVEKAREVTSNLDVTIVQGDLLNPPFQPASFDCVFSIGVLHHSANTRQAFQAIAKLLKPQGQLAVWVYRKNTWPQEALNTLLRSVTTRMPASVLLPLCYVPAFLAGIPGLNKVLGRILNLGATHPVWRMRLCDAFDWYSPKYQFHHTPDEVAGWFKDAGVPRPRTLPPQKQGRIYSWTYNHDLIIGSGVNMVGTKE